jgi:hypothetical protein
MISEVSRCYPLTDHDATGVGWFVTTEVIDGGG